ncbi:MAG: iron-containing alcohol dehydrogenase [Spirochaetes bacterium]|jgi:alcohol dehydrogenase class IV|nr:iron-containing alcohol dehydrogenase [Spirochaetota bacterium]
MQTPEYFEFLNQAKIISGKKALEHIPIELDGFNSRKPLVVTSKAVSGAKLDRVLAKAFYDSNTIIGGIFDEVPEHSSFSLAKELSILFKGRGCDSIIAFGGGSVADVAKGVNIMVSEKNEDLLSFIGEGKVKTRLKPFVYIPVSYSDGTEMTNVACIDHRIIKSDFLYPDIIAMDPRATKGCCRECVVSTAMTALTHAIEASSVAHYNPVSDTYAHSAIQFIYENLAKGVKSLGNARAGLALANAAVMAGITFANAPAGLIHTIADALSSITGHNRGTMMGVLLPFGLEYKISKKLEIRGELLLALAGLDEYVKTPEKEMAVRSLGLIKNLIKSLKGALPEKLSDMKIPEYHLNEAAKIAFNASGKKYKEQVCLDVLQHAYEGKSFI